MDGEGDEATAAVPGPENGLMSDGPARRGGVLCTVKVKDTIVLDGTPHAFVKVPQLCPPALLKAPPEPEPKCDEEAEAEPAAGEEAEATNPRSAAWDALAGCVRFVCSLFVARAGEADWKAYLDCIDLLSPHPEGEQEVAWHPGGNREQVVVRWESGGGNWILGLGVR